MLNVSSELEENLKRFNKLNERRGCSRGVGKNSMSERHGSENLKNYEDNEGNFDQVLFISS